MTHYLLFLRVEHVHINNWWAIFCPSVECVDFIKQTVETQDSCLSYTHIWQLLHVHKPHLALVCMQMTSALLFWSAVMHVKSIITRAAVRWDFVARQRRMNQVQLPLQTVDMEQNISQFSTGFCVQRAGLSFRRRHCLWAALTANGCCCWSCRMVFSACSSSALVSSLCCLTVASSRLTR